MPPHLLLAKLRAHLDCIPEMAGKGSYTIEHYSWLARAHTIVSLWDTPRLLVSKMLVIGPQEI